MYQPLEEAHVPSPSLSPSPSPTPGMTGNVSLENAALRREIAELQKRLANSEGPSALHMSIALRHFVQSIVQAVGGRCSMCTRKPATAGSSNPNPSTTLSKGSKGGKRGGDGALVDSADGHVGPKMISEDDWEQHKHRGLLFPVAPLKFKWDAWIFFLIIYSCVVVPFRIGMSHASEGAWWAFEFFMTICFMADLVASFYTAYREGDQFVIHKPMIRDNCKAYRAAAAAAAAAAGSTAAAAAATADSFPRLIA